MIVMTSYKLNLVEIIATPPSLLVVVTPLLERIYIVAIFATLLTGLNLSTSLYPLDSSKSTARVQKDECLIHRIQLSHSTSLRDRLATIIVTPTRLEIGCKKLR